MSDLHRLIDRVAWERVRRYVLERDGWLCADCGRPGHEVDHVRPLHRGGAELAADNLQVLCRSCHIRKTARENQRPQGPKESAWRALVSKPLRSHDSM